MDKSLSQFSPDKDTKSEIILLGTQKGRNP
jgi:hypothetical protein